MGWFLTAIGIVALCTAYVWLYQAIEPINRRGQSINRHPDRWNDD